MIGSPLRGPTKQVCIECSFTQDLSSSPTGLNIYTLKKKKHSNKIKSKRNSEMFTTEPTHTKLHLDR